MYLNNVIQYILRTKREIRGMNETATGEPVSLDKQNWFFSLYLLPQKGKHDGVIRHHSKRENGNLDGTLRNYNDPAFAGTI